MSSTRRPSSSRSSARCTRNRTFTSRTPSISSPAIAAIRTSSPWRRSARITLTSIELGDLLRKVRQDDPAGYKKVAIYLKDRSLPPTALQYTMSIHPNVRDRPTDHLEDVFAEVDILMSPTLDRTAWICGEAGIVPPTYVAYTHIVNNAGFCAASVPAGFVDGLPVGLHLIARPGEEALLFRVCRAFEKARPWAQDRPTIVSVENTQRWVNR